MKLKKIEVFCGTGGVGKTTISTSRALHLSSKGSKVLLITLDPSKRLKQVLGIKDDRSGEAREIDLTLFGIKSSGKLDAILLDPSMTLKRILGKDIENTILKSLSRPHGGLNEIMAVIEIQHHLDAGLYDTIILDTPPGKHFIDFLESSKRIKLFFDHTFAEIFKFAQKQKKPKRIIGSLLSSGIDKLLSYLEKVTGKGFVNEFVEAVHTLYEKRELFLKGLKLEKDLLDKETTNWFLVTSADQIKGHEAQNLIDSASAFMHSSSYLIVNKSWKKHLEMWTPDASDTDLVNLKKKLESQEEEIEKTADKYTIKKINFPEIIETSPLEQVKNLMENWTQS